MYQLLKNPKTHQIAVKGPRNTKLDNSIGAIEGASYFPQYEMWVLPEEYIDEMEYLISKISVSSIMGAKPETAPAAKPDNVIPLNPAPVITEQPKEVKPEQPKEEPAKVIPMTAKEETSEPEQKPADTQPAPKSEEKPVNWFDKLMAEYNKAKENKNETDMKIIKYVGAQARKNTELQKLVEQKHKTYDRLCAFLDEKVLAMIKEIDRKGRVAVQVDDDIVYRWAIDYFYYDDLAKIQEEERKKAEAAEKRKKDEADRKEKEQKRKERAERAAKKAAKEAAKEAAIVKETALSAPDPVSEPKAEDPAPVVAATQENPVESDVEDFDGQMNLF